MAGRLEEYRDQHLQCTDGDAMPGPYIVVRIEDKAAGIDNELPGVITGAWLAEQLTIIRLGLVLSSYDQSTC